MRFFESPNFYAHVENNPLNSIDTSGLQAQRPGNLPIYLWARRNSTGDPSPMGLMKL